MILKVQFACSIFIYLAAAAIVSAQTQSTIPTNEVIIAHIAQAQAENRTHFRPYIVTRDYKLFKGDHQNQAQSRVTAEITVVPPDSKKYTVENSNGSGLEEQIVRKMLDGEVAFAKDSGSTGITRDNYDFLFVREVELSGQRCYVLELLPRASVTMNVNVLVPTAVGTPLIVPVVPLNRSAQALISMQRSISGRTSSGT